MDGIDTIRKFTEDMISENFEYRREEEELKREHILLLERAEEEDEDRAKEKEHAILHATISSTIPVPTSQRPLLLPPLKNTVLYITNSRVIPSSIPLDSWSTSFLLSDHRPVSSSIILANPTDCTDIARN
jgi:hypothetical protein